MKFLAVAVLIPCLALASPIETRDIPQNVVLKNIEVETLLTGSSLTYNNGNYDILAVSKSRNVTASGDFVTEKFLFPATSGKLTVYDGTGQLVGNIVPNQNSGFDLNFESKWLSVQADEALPKLRFPYGSEDLIKRHLSLGLIGYRIGRYSGGPGSRGNEFAVQLGILIKNWIFDERDDSGASLLTPIFVQGPGVTFESFLGLGGIDYSGKTINLVGFGTVFVDIDDVVDLYDCDFCQFPTSSS